jgi:hypothetical protein
MRLAGHVAHMEKMINEHRDWSQSLGRRDFSRGQGINGRIILKTWEGVE